MNNPNKYIKYLKSLNFEQFEEVSCRNFESLIYDEIEDVNRNYERFLKQSKCKHNPTGLRYEWSDSHYDYYVERCKDCGKTLKEDKV